MSTVGEILARLDAIAPLARAGGWDPVGLQVGDLGATASRVAVCHEATTPVIDAALDAGAGMLIAYHPLLFRPTTRFVEGRLAAGRAFRLAAGGVALAVVHTAYDVAAGGVADSLAAALDLQGCRPFGPNWAGEVVKVVTFVPGSDADAVVAAMASAGAGVIGGYTGCSFRAEGVGSFVAPGGAGAAAEAELRIEMIAPAGRRDAVVAALAAAHPYEEPAYDVYEVKANAGFIGRIGTLPMPTTLGDFARTVETKLGARARVAGDLERQVGRVAVAPGSGSSFAAAVVGDADVLVTGDVGHHTARDAVANGLAIVDPGHTPTERPGVQKLYSAVSQMVDDAVDLTGVDANVWKS